MRGTNSLAIGTSFSTFLLLVAGALVTSTGSGLAVPDWPLSFGQFFPPMVGGVLFEHGHRVIAGIVAVLTAILTVSLWLKEKRVWICWLASGAFCVVILQALLGGITVLNGLPQAVSIAHAVLAQIFFGLTVSIALFTSAYWENSSCKLSQPCHYLSAAATALLFIQLILGAGLRHGGGLIFLKLHILAALIVAGAVVSLSLTFIKRLTSDRTLLFLAVALMPFLLLQIFLGLAAVLPMIGRSVFIPVYLRTVIVTLHVAIGALLLAISLIITFWNFRFAFEGRIPSGTLIE